MTFARASLPVIGLLLWVGAAVAGWVLARRAGWSAGELVIAGSVWALVLLVAARRWLRDLFGPVFVYETVRVGRRTSTFVFRWIYIGGILSLLALLYYSWSHSVAHYGANVPPVRLSEFATMYFETVAVVQLAVVVLLTPGYVAATITNEKERQTLEFLLATDLKNREIVFGKLAARTITLCMFVLAALPVLGFLQLFGGIDPDLALASAAAAVLTVVGLSAVSLAFSAAMRKSRDAIAVSYLVILGYLAVSFTLAMVAREVLVGKNLHLADFGLFVVDWSVVADWFAGGNALYVYTTETNGGRAVGGDVIARMLGRYAAFWGVVTLLALGYAVLRVRAVALRQSHGTPRTAPKRIAAARPAMGTQPVLWREVFGSTGRTGGGGWFFRFVIVGLTAVIPAILVYNMLWESGGRPWLRTFADEWSYFLRDMSQWLRMTTGVLTTLILFGVALRGAAAVAGERDKDTWLSLISAPVTPQELLLGKWAGAVLSMRFAYGVLLGVWAVGLAIGAVHPAMVLATAAYVFLFASAFSWVGIVCSLTAKTTLGASTRAFAATAFLGGGFWLLFGVCCALPVGIMQASGGGDFLETPTMILLGGTPPFLAGWAPMMDFDREGLGPFHPAESHFGPLAPVAGAGFWIAFNLVLASTALQLMTRAMNRQPSAAPPSNRPTSTGWDS